MPEKLIHKLRPERYLVRSLVIQGGKTGIFQKDTQTKTQGRKVPENQRREVRAWGPEMSSRHGLSVGICRPFNEFGLYLKGNGKPSTWRRVLKKGFEKRSDVSIFSISRTL